MTNFLSKVNAIVWGAPALLAILGVGLFLSVRMGFPQLRLFPRAMADFWRRLRGSEGEEGSSFRCLCTALAATVGTGNLVGVAGAICLGGPGAIFWMWLCGLLGMGTKFAEAMLAVRYRVKTGEGYAGGPMYMMTGALGRWGKPLALSYCVCGLAAAFGVGNAAQVSAVRASVEEVLTLFRVPFGNGGRLLLGLLLAVLVGNLLLGGAKRIGAAAEALVPVLAVGYILMCAGVLAARYRQIPAAFTAIFAGAFSPKAVTGGMIGSAFGALRVGCSRGVFTNEAGMGTASIAHAAARVRHPTEQGLMGIVEVFLDTIVLCTLTALVILCSGVAIPYGRDAGGSLTTAAFASVYGPGAAIVLAVALACFAIATILGWSLYGGRCAQFLFGPKAWRGFALAQAIAVVFGTVLDTAALWQLSETFNGLMAIPNLLILAALCPEARRLTKEYRTTGNAVHGGYYADFHQRQSL